MTDDGDAPMTYPKVDFLPDQTTADHVARAGVVASPKFPEVEQRVLDYWAEDKTFEASVEAARRRRERRQRVRLLRRPAVRQRPAALRPPAHRLRQGRGAALPDHARPPGRAPVRLGLPRPAGRGRGGEAARHHHQERDPRAGRGQVQRGLPRLGAAVHPGLGALRHPPGPLGRLRQRLQDARPDLHGVRHVGLQDPARQGPGLRGLPGAGVLLAVRDAAVQHRDPDGRRLPDRQDPALTVVRCRELESRRAALAVWTTTPWTLPSNLALAVGPDIDYAVLERATASRRYVLGEARLRHYAKELGGLRPRSARVTGRELVGRRYTPLFDFLVEQAGTNAFQVLAGRLRHHRGRHRRRALAPAFGEDDQTSATPPASRPWSLWTSTRKFTAARSPATRGMQVFEANKPVHPRAQGARACVLRHDTLHPLVPALLALRHPAGLQGGVVAGSSR